MGGYCQLLIVCLIVKVKVALCPFLTELVLTDGRVFFFPDGRFLTVYVILWNSPENLLDE